MEESSLKKQESRHESKQRKVRFKLASSYSGRVLKHVYEDGQELESPEEKYPHSFIDAKTPQHLDIEQLCSFGETQDQDLNPPTAHIAQRINVYRGLSGYKPSAYNNLQDEQAPVLDFGKIIIYTSNLKIIRSPNRKSERGSSRHRSRGEGGEASPGRESRSKERRRSKSGQKERRSPTPTVQLNESPTAKEKEMAGCEQCGGSGTAPCSLCHGSKLSMLANRFNESIRELRCPACNPHGLEQCQSCV
ncbi:glutaredoxin domain-containing cysteine-rich protein 2 [Trichomycterus rosablanca]|uniref:glutaredoxin domain-containing cysteine-rich protein 2 n=1 Tax=Trichomycterus rosablanca TaxID=2290929 RepID=UPI002F358FC6